MKIGIVGSGTVGASAAFALVMGGAASEVVLLDPQEPLVRAQARDLEDAAPFGHGVRVVAGAYADLAGAQAVVLCGGVRSVGGESRLALLARNLVLFRELVPPVVEQAPEAILIVVSNPVDILTEFVCRTSGLPRGRVFGTGTMLDTARFRTSLGRLLGVSPRSVHGYVLGEHGDSEVLAWSGVTVGGIPLAAFAEQVGVDLGPNPRAQVDGDVRHAARDIIQGKGSTCYGIGGAIARLVRVLRDDERTLLTVSAPAPELAPEGGPVPCLSLPRIVGSAGVLRTLLPELSVDEHAALARSAAVLREAAVGAGMA
jgi:L-lactate dehydrogenase